MVVLITFESSEGNQKYLLMYEHSATFSIIISVVKFMISIKFLKKPDIYYMIKQKHPINHGRHTGEQGCFLNLLQLTFQLKQQQKQNQVEILEINLKIITRLHNLIHLLSKFCPDLTHITSEKRQFNRKYLKSNCLMLVVCQRTVDIKSKSNKGISHCPPFVISLGQQQQGWQEDR